MEKLVLVQTTTVAKDSNSTKLASELVSSEVPRGAWENVLGGGYHVHILSIGTSNLHHTILCKLFWYNM